MHAFTRDRASGRAEIEITPMSSHGARGITCAEGHSAPSSRGRELKLLSRWPFGQKARQLVKRLLVKKWPSGRKMAASGLGEGAGGAMATAADPGRSSKFQTANFVGMGAGSAAAHSDRPSDNIAKTR